MSMNPSIVDYRGDTMDEKPCGDEGSLADAKEGIVSGFDPEELLNSPIFEDLEGNVDSLLRSLDTIPSSSNFQYDDSFQDHLSKGFAEAPQKPSHLHTRDLDIDDDLHERLSISSDVPSFYEPGPFPDGMPEQTIAIDSNGFPIEKLQSFPSGSSGYPLDRNGPPISSPTPFMELDHVSSSFHENFGFGGRDASASSQSVQTLSPRSHQSDQSPNVSAYNEAMEKLCESMRRSAMSRSLVKQFSGRKLGKQSSNRSLTKQGSNRSLNKLVSSQTQARGNLGKKQGSFRSLDDGGRLTPTYSTKGRTSVEAKHRMARDALSHSAHVLGRAPSRKSHSGSSKNTRLSAILMLDESKGKTSFDGDSVNSCGKTVHSGP